MKRLLLALVITAGTLSHGMEPEKELIKSIDFSIPEVSELQMFHHFSEELCSDIARSIFSLRIKAGGIDLSNFADQIKPSHRLAEYVEPLIKSCGYNLFVELFKTYFTHEKISICDIRDEPKSFNCTALHYASMNNFIETAKLLLNAAGDNKWTLLAMENKHGWTALHYATWQEHTEIVKLLLDAAGDNMWTLLAMKDHNGYTAFEEAALNGRTKIVNTLLNAADNKAQDLIAMRDRPGRTTLHNAVRHYDTGTVTLLLNAAGGNLWALLTMKDSQEWTALHHAVYWDRTETVKLLLNAAGNKAHNLMAIMDKNGDIAFNLTDSQEVREVMLQHMLNSNQ